MRLRSLGRDVATTALCNIVATAAAGIAGLVIARSLGPSGRGEYAAIIAWLSVVLVIGHLGLTAAITYFVARVPGQAADHLATVRAMALTTGSLVILAALAVAPMLASDSSGSVLSYRAMFLVGLVDFAAAAYTSALQGHSIDRWNLVRIVQPGTFLLGVVVLQLSGNLTLSTVLGAVAVTMVAQSVAGYMSCRRLGLTGGRVKRDLVRPLGRYGLAQLAAVAPAVVIARLDILVLSMVVAPTALGAYAVASSLTALALPLVSAVGYVVFPRLAARGQASSDSNSLQVRGIMVAALLSVLMMSTLVIASPWLIPLVFGEAYRQAVPLILLLAPAGVFLACGQVCGDVLRGCGRPMVVAKAQVIAAAVTGGLMVVLVPGHGVSGAAIATSAAAIVGTALMIRAIVWPPTSAMPEAAAELVSSTERVA